MVSELGSVCSAGGGGGRTPIAAVLAALNQTGVCVCSGLMGSADVSAASAVAARTELQWIQTARLFKPSLKGADVAPAAVTAPGVPTASDAGAATPRDDTVLWLDPDRVAHAAHLPTLLAVEARLALLGAALTAESRRQALMLPTAATAEQNTREQRKQKHAAFLSLSSRSGAMVACYDGGGAQYRPHIDNPCGCLSDPPSLATTSAAAAVALKRHEGDDGVRDAAVLHASDTFSDRTYSSPSQCTDSTAVAQPQSNSHACAYVSCAACSCLCSGAATTHSDLLPE